MFAAPARVTVFRLSRPAAPIVVCGEQALRRVRARSLRINPRAGVILTKRDRALRSFVGVGWGTPARDFFTKALPLSLIV